jgi:recombination protein RecT
MSTQIATAERRADPVTVFRQTISQPSMRQQIKMALPSHISVEKFERVATTAVQTNPDLLNPEKVNSRSLFGALVRAAQDGLLPDGREGAIIPFKGKAQWMPMVAGIMKKVRNSGEIANWDAFPVFEKDKFQRLLGDDQRLYHEPYDEGDPGDVIGAYSIVTFKDGTKSKDYLPRWRIEKAREQNPIGKNSLMWTKFYDEGAVKTVIRHHAKRLPQSTDIEALFERDDTMRHVEEDAAPALEGATPASRLDALEHRLDTERGEDTATEEVAVEEAPAAEEQQTEEALTLESAKAEIDKAGSIGEIADLYSSLSARLSDDDARELMTYGDKRAGELSPVATSGETKPLFERMQEAAK